MFKALFLILAMSTLPQAAKAAIWLDQGCESIAVRCEEDIKSIYIFGNIDQATYDGLIAYNEFHPSEKPFPKIYINSDGGYTYWGKKIGAFLRKKSAVIESKDFFFPEHKARCYSACVLVAAGATTRNLTHIGVHQSYISNRLKGGGFEILPPSSGALERKIEYFNSLEMPQELIHLIKQAKSPTHFFNVYLDLDEPLESQLLHKLGFRQSPITDEERLRLRNLKPPISDIDSLLFAAEKLDYPHAMEELAQRFFYGQSHTPVDRKKGFDWFERCVAKGDISCKHNVAVILENGTGGIKKDKKRAMRLYREAATGGHAGSQNNLGWSYYRGIGVKKNLAEAIFWITRAVEQGEPFAYGSLGTIMFEGNGFIRDEVEIYKWLKLAVLNMPKGQARDEEDKRLSELIKYMSDKKIEEGERRVRNWEPLRQQTTPMFDVDDD
jgi:hypothetical protein